MPYSPRINFVDITSLDQHHHHRHHLHHHGSQNYLHNQKHSPHDSGPHRRFHHHHHHHHSPDPHHPHPYSPPPPPHPHHQQHLCDDFADGHMDVNSNDDGEAPGHGPGPRPPKQWMTQQYPSSGRNPRRSQCPCYRKSGCSWSSGEAVGASDATWGAEL